MAAAYLIHTDGLCSGCGVHLDDSTHESLNPDNRTDSRTGRVVVSPPRRCHTCTALDEASEEIASDRSTKHLGALRLGVHVEPIRKYHT